MHIGGDDVLHRVDRSPAALEATAKRREINVRRAPARADTVLDDLCSRLDACSLVSRRSLSSRRTAHTLTTRRRR